MITPEQQWAEILQINPTLTDEDKALFYTGITAGINMLALIMKPHITNELQEKVWPQLDPILRSLETLT